MNQYRIFIVAFIISIVAMIMFFASYFSGLINFIRLVSHQDGIQPDPFYFFSTIFSPVMLISLLVLMAASLLYRVLGIIFIARNLKLAGGEQAMWIIGFVLIGFVTAIVFMALAKSRNLLVATASVPDKTDYP